MYDFIARAVLLGALAAASYVLAGSLRDGYRWAKELFAPDERGGQ